MPLLIPLILLIILPLVSALSSFDIGDTSNLEADKIERINAVLDESDFLNWDGERLSYVINSDYPAQYGYTPLAIVLGGGYDPGSQYLQSLGINMTVEEYNEAIDRLRNLCFRAEISGIILPECMSNG